MISSDAKTPKDMLVVGGADGMGMWLVKRLFADAPEVRRITLADVKPLLRPGDGRAGEGRARNPDGRHAAELARVPKPVDAVRLANGHEFAEWAAVETAAEPPESALALRDYALVMLAVPEDRMEFAASAILPRLAPGATVFDVCSTKSAPVAAMLEHSPRGVGVMGVHPLFGPAVPDAIGQTFVMAPTARTDPAAYEWLASLIRSKGAIVEETDAETHDRYMLLVQTLAHYAYLVFGKTLAKASESGYAFTESLRYSTPPYSVLVAFTSRIIGGNPHLYSQIQAQPESEHVRSMFVEAARELAGRFELGEPEIRQAIEEIVRPFQGSDIARAYSNSVAVVDSVQQSYRDLHRRMEEGELTIVQVRDPFSHDNAERLHVGVVTDVDGRSVEITKRQAVVNGKWYLAYDAESESALRQHGIGAPRSAARIERRNVRRVFGAEETREWRAANLAHLRRDISVLVDEGVDIDYICSVLARINDSVLSGRAQEAQGARWLRRYGMANVVLRFTIYGDRDPQACVRELVESLRLFGIKTP